MDATPRDRASTWREILPVTHATLIILLDRELLLNPKAPRLASSSRDFTRDMITSNALTTFPIAVAVKCNLSIIRTHRYNLLPFSTVKVGTHYEAEKHHIGLGITLALKEPITYSMILVANVRLTNQKACSR
jgi:hypothetical protein